MLEVLGLTLAVSILATMGGGIILWRDLMNRPVLTGPPIWSGWLFVGVMTLSVILAFTYVIAYLARAI